MDGEDAMPQGGGVKKYRYKPCLEDPMFPRLQDLDFPI